MSTESHHLHDIGNVLDRAAPRLREFIGKPEHLRQYLRAKFGHQLMRGRKSRNKPETNANGGAFLEPEEAADAIAGLVVGGGSDSHVTNGGREEMNMGNNHSNRQDGHDNSEHVAPTAPKGQSEVGYDPGQPPEGWGPASMRAEMAVHEGRPCPICGRTTERLGLYQLAGGRLVRIKGNGPTEIDPGTVFDRTGELRARAYD